MSFYKSRRRAKERTVFVWFPVEVGLAQALGGARACAPCEVKFCDDDDDDDDV